MQRETALEVNEGLATPRAPASEDVLVDVSAGAHDFPLLFVQLRQPAQLGVEPLLHFTLELRRHFLLEELQARRLIIGESRA